MRKRYILATLVILLAIFGLSGSSRAEFDTNRSEEVLTLIEKGSQDKEAERYVHALRKYKEAMAIVREELAKEPENMRALLLKELLENKVKECKSVVSKIEEEIDPDLPYKTRIKEAYALVEKADSDKNKGKFYVALKGYNEAEKKIKSALKNAPESEEAWLLLELVKRKIVSSREEMTELEGVPRGKKAFSEDIGKITRTIEKSSIDEKNGKYLIALQGYSEVLKSLQNLEKNYPGKAQRISLTREMVDIKIASCKEKIKSIEKNVKQHIIIEEAEQKPVPKREKIQPVRLAREEIIATGIAEVVPGEAEEARDEAEGEVFVVEKPKPEPKKPEPRRPEPEPRRPEPEPRRPKPEPRKPEAKALSEEVGDFIAESRKSGRVEALRAKSANQKTLGDMKKRAKNTLGIIKAKNPLGRIRNFISQSREAGRAEALRASSANLRRLANIKNGLKGFLRTIKSRIKRKIPAAKEKRVSPRKPVIEKREVLKRKIAEPEVTPVPEEIVEPQKIIEPEIAEEKAPSPVKAAVRGEKKEWIEATKAEPTGYDFSGYKPDPGITFYYGDDGFKFDAPCLRKGEEIWAPVKEFTGLLNMTYLEPGKQAIIIIRRDGTPLEMNLGKTGVLVNKAAFLEMPAPLAIYNGEFMLSLDSLKKALDIACRYSPDANSVTIAGKKKAAFTTFKVEKPEAPAGETKKTAPSEEEALKLPREMREELLPTEYYPDIDLRLDSTFRYFEDMLNRDRTRYNEYSLSGKMYGVDVSGNLSMRDFESGDKSVWKEDAQHLSFFKGGTGLKLLDNHIGLPGVRSQSQGYWGAELQDESGLMKNVWIGETDTVSIAKLDGTGSAKYSGKLYAAKQDWIKTDKLELSAVELLMYNSPETADDKGTTGYPRRNFVYLLDSNWLVRPALNIYNTLAHSVYNPDNKEDKIIGDYDVKTGMTYTHDRFNIDSYVEYVGDRYASLGIPLTYQDYLGWNTNTGFKITKNFGFSISGNMNRDNVAFDDELPTSHSRGISTSANLRLPWDQSLNASWGYNRFFTEGGGRDSTGNEFNSYRIDYYKALGTASLQLGWQHYRMDPLSTNTGSLLYHTYSATLYKSFPELNGSYIRLYQDLTKTKQLSMNGSPTENIWNTDLSGKYFFSPKLALTGNWRLRGTFQDDRDDTSVMALSAGINYVPFSSTTIGLTYEVDNMDLYDNRRSTKDWSLLLFVRHAFDIRSPEKWGTTRVYVFEDLNGNNIMDEGERGLEDILAYVINGRGARTGSDGIALIKRIVPGERKVRLDMRGLPVDMVIKGDLTRDVTVEPRKTSDVTFIVVTTGMVKGRVFVDMNKDGIFDKNKDIPLPNVRVFLTPEHKDTLTFSDGSYRFEYVHPGRYEVGIDLEDVPKEYKLLSSESLVIEVEARKVAEDTDFTFESRPIKIKHF
jgi:tetratricopeptide (TPR) repeat protein